MALRERNSWNEIKDFTEKVGNRKSIQTKKTKETKVTEPKVNPSSPAISNSEGTGQNIRDF